ncbi:hypothetical protein ACIRSS_39870 [Amycolatopsis sp. NPDC101161]|uniref:hypothetical protein n=1 Tax=Amycolatopsis sp. NPDC101161 TaxID=3363940 RepID=UPI0037FD6F8B
MITVADARAAQSRSFEERGVKDLTMVYLLSGPVSQDFSWGTATHDESRLVCRTHANSGISTVRLSGAVLVGATAPPND